MAMLEMKNIALDEAKSNSITITIADHGLFKETVKLFRSLIKQDAILNNKLAVKTTRSNIKTFTVKHLGDLPAGANSLREVIEQLLTKAIHQELSITSGNPQVKQSPQPKSSAKPTSTALNNDCDDDDEMPSKLSSTAIIEFDPFDFAEQESTELLGISGEDFCSSASSVRVQTDHYYLDDDDGSYGLDFS